MSWVISHGISAVKSETPQWLSTLRLICGLTGNIVRPGSTETPSSMNRRWPCCETTAHLTRFATATGPRNFRSSRWRAKRPRVANMQESNMKGCR